jgi:hypothetical protein
MGTIRRCFEQVVVCSTYGITLLTILIVMLIAGFVVQGVRLVGNSNSASSTANESANIDTPLSDEAALPDRAVPPPAKRISPLDNVAAIPIEPSERYASSRGTAARGAPVVARLTRTCDCRWAEDAEAPREGAPLRVGQTLRIAAGLAEIAFACGAKAILEGPAVLELQSEKTSDLRSGRMTADVPDEVVGFTVHTPVAALCALQTPPVARVSATSDCRFAKESAVTKEGAALQPGQCVAILEGLAEITFACGAKVILQGPANLEIESSKTGILHAGKLTADVPDDLEGFKIRTAVVEVVALPDNAKDSKSGDKKKGDNIDDDSGVVILKAGEHAQIESPAKKTTKPAPIAKKGATKS